MEANRLMDERRRFTEAVLSGASSGVIGLDRHGVITLANTVAEGLLLGETRTAPLQWQSLAAFIPEAENLHGRALEVEYATPNGPRRTLLLRVTDEKGGAGGAVATLDDISALASAQRKAAWADVARRIAHEIKNPLTPIQLSAERLRRKYLPQISEDPETFEKCTETIIRQVHEIGHLVGEFSSYARMPLPVKRVENVVDVCRDALVLQRQAHGDIDISFDAGAARIDANCDRSQLTQVLTNLIQNAIDSVHERLAAQPDAPKGRVAVACHGQGGNVVISVEDNGLGLPEKVRDQLLEPYVTTKKKGSGLGLAIVKKIMEDHGGEITLENIHREGLKSGAKAVIIFSKGMGGEEAVRQG
jgi:two-component system nitrogen regulation sensor histidine kinase NtrY